MKETFNLSSKLVSNQNFKIFNKQSKRNFHFLKIIHSFLSNISITTFNGSKSQNNIFKNRSRKMTKIKTKEREKIKSLKIKIRNKTKTHLKNNKFRIKNHNKQRENNLINKTKKLLKHRFHIISFRNRLQDSKLVKKRKNRKKFLRLLYLKLITLIFEKPQLC